MVVVDVRERPDQAVRDEQRARDDDGEDDDQSDVHGVLLRAVVHKIAQRCLDAIGNPVNRVAVEPQRAGVPGSCPDLRIADPGHPGCSRGSPRVERIGLEGGVR